MVTLDTIADAFGFNQRMDADWSTLGKVAADNGDGTLSVLLGGSATPTTCQAYCIASAGDIVFVVISKGKARAIARQGGNGGGSAVWGAITGTLSDQTDLANALADKADASSFADYVIEEGTSGIWTYRKWNSGVSECWGIYEWKLTAQSTWGSMYYATPESTAQSYPAGLFIDTPVEQGTINYRNGDVLTTRLNNTGSSTTSGRYYAMRPASFGLNANAELSLYAIGRWQ